MARNTPSNENERRATKTTLYSKALNENGRRNKELSRQNEDEIIHFQQNSTERDAKGTVLRK